MNRDEMENILVNDDLEHIYGDHGNSDSEYLESLLRGGFQGYENYTEDELVEELRERGLFDDGENVDIELDPYDETPHEFNTEGKFIIEE